MIKKVSFKIEASFNDKSWKDKNLNIPDADKACDILEELEEMNPALSYRIVKVTEELV